MFCAFENFQAPTEFFEITGVLPVLRDETFSIFMKKVNPN